MKKVILNTKKVSLHPEDLFLEIHLVHLPEKNEFATYMYNGSTNSHNVGRYFESSEEAMKDFLDRV